MHISFKASTGSDKPNTLIDKELTCPFCNQETLFKEGRVIRKTDEFMIIKNKFPVMENTFPTIIIEHKDCNQHIATYSVDYLTRLLTFAIEFYNELNESKKYTSTILFKNHGLFSGGSIKHPHMQVVGFENDDYHQNVSKEDFEGVPILSNPILDWNISSKPRSEFYEINLILKDLERIDVLALHLQKTVHYILQQLNKKYQCYNLAFYIEKNEIKIKVISRSPTSVLLLGFGIHQTPNNLKEVAEKLSEY